MPNEWLISNGKACYNTPSPNYQLIQSNVMVIGKMYNITLEITGMTQGKLSIPTINGASNLTNNGLYDITGLATYQDLIIIGQALYGNTFDGCIDIVELIEIPFYTIYNINNVAVYTLIDNTGVTSADGFVQYQIDWSDLPYGAYYIQFNNSGLDYRTDYFNVQLLHDCSVQVTWKCNENAWNFNYSNLDFTQSLRIDAKLWLQRFKALDKDVYEYSNGDLEIVYVSKTQETIFTTEELPLYIHQALQLAVDSDLFYIDAIKYVYPDDDYTPIWRKSSNLASVEVTLRKAQNLRNVNCG